MTQITVTIEHVRAEKMCVRGARQWFNLHGLSFETFLANGYPVEVIEATGDALGLRVAERARLAAQGEEE